MNSNFRITIVGDDAEWRCKYFQLLSEVKDFQIVGVCSPAEFAIKGLKGEGTQLVLLAVNNQEIDMFSDVREMRKNYPMLKIAILSEIPKMIFEALELGVSGYLEKDIQLEKLIESVRCIIEGGAVMSSSATKIVISSFQRNLNSPLTKRETEILEQISEGYTKPQIASSLFINQNTVRSHVKNIYIKLNVNSKSAAIKTAKILKLI